MTKACYADITNQPNSDITIYVQLEGETPCILLASLVMTKSCLYYGRNGCACSHIEQQLSLNASCHFRYLSPNRLEVLPESMTLAPLSHMLTNPNVTSAGILALQYAFTTPYIRVGARYNMVIGLTAMVYNKHLGHGQEASSQPPDSSIQIWRNYTYSA